MYDKTIMEYLCSFFNKLQSNKVYFREKIPSVMQDDCDEIYPAVLVSTKQGPYAYESMTDVDTPFETIVYGPAAQNQNGK